MHINFKLNSKLAGQVFMFFILPVSAALLSVLHPGLASASTIPMTAGGDQIGQQIASTGSQIGGYATDGMYVCFGIAGLSLLTTVGEYFFLKEHKKAIHNTLGVAIGSGVLGGIMAAVSHGEAGNTAASGAMISGAVHHAALILSVHLKR